MWSCCPLFLSKKSRKNLVHRRGGPKGLKCDPDSGIGERNGNAKGYHVEDPDGFSGHLHSHCEGWACFHCVLSVAPISPNYFWKANGCGVHTCSATMEGRKWQNHAEWQNLFEQVLVTTSPQFTKTNLVHCICMPQAPNVQLKKVTLWLQVPHPAQQPWCLKNITSIASRCRNTAGNIWTCSQAIPQPHRRVSGAEKTPSEQMPNFPN